MGVMKKTTSTTSEKFSLNAIISWYFKHLTVTIFLQQLVKFISQKFLKKSQRKIGTVEITKT
ncbi:hypothetical protein C3B51_15025 [Pseudoalteromonas rubra]|uniref:Uncharacterized protein n=1 Tax=Pseudoalteromonas rubra TaxID=43658 RepID=A0A4Q7E7I4_9GAMM|nr:hypothetical protein C3B51_15025 [Pseudoalteromonas rubra]